MKKNCFNTITAALLVFILWGCNSQKTEQLTQQQKDQIISEVKATGDSIITKVENLDIKWLDYYVDSPDWGMANADGSRWDYQTTLKAQPDFFNAAVSWKWTSTHENFIVLTKDIIICAWDGKDETVLKSGEKITYDPHTYTLIFKKIVGRWRVIYSHDSGVPVVQPASTPVK
jgi:uncharacterized lipoprotein NlpE involved in copper resistance